MKITEKKPKVSVMVCTYNRADIISEMFDSVINQTYTDFEFIIVNNGSTDHTAEVLKDYEKDPRVRILNIEVNEGYAKGYNHGLDNLRGEWFGVASDDDPLTLDALEVMMRIPEEVDPEVNAVTANTRAKSTGEWNGKGVTQDQYLDIETIVTKCSGEFWGLTKTELLGDLRFNGELPGNDNVLWYKIDDVAKRYYVHRVVVTFNDEGDSITGQTEEKNVKRQTKIYQELLKEEHYWSVLKKYYLKKYRLKSFKGWLFLTMANDVENATKYFQMWQSSHPGILFKSLRKVLGLFDGKKLEAIYRLWPKNLSKFLKRS